VAATTLTTPRLRLRGWQHDDEIAFAAMHADPEVMAFLGGALDRAASDALLAQLDRDLQRDGWGRWAVEHRGGGLLGFTGLARLTFATPFTPAIEVGWRFTRDAWGHGYATEAARAALTYAFDLLGLDEVVSITVPANVPSRRVMERLGMKRDEDGDFEHPGLPVGHALRAHVLYRITGDDFRAPQPGR
jgi:RimJ/RimL family protein N-acetyltransferase